jgi:signal transduction histidine kinase
LVVNGECRSSQHCANWPGEIDLGTGAARVEVRFTAPEFVAPEHARFRWRLAGLDQEWRDAGGQRLVSFTHLPAGRYRLEVIASEAGGKWTEPSSLSFVLHPHFWETTWFYTICALAGCLTVGAAVRIAMMRQAACVRARMDKLRAVDAERARISKDLHDDLGTTLTQIAVFSELAQADIGQPEEAVGHMERVFEMAQSSARALDEIVWASNPVHDTLESFVSHISKMAQDFARAAGLKFRFDAPMSVPSVDLPAMTRHHLFLVSKEALHNVVKHAQATTVRLRLALEPGFFALTVEDDGCGFSSPCGEAGADGLLNMERRVKDLGGRFECTSAAGAGTAISVRVPLTEQKPECCIFAAFGLAAPSHS